MNKRTLGVIFGGRTCEHEVSVISALQLINNADQEKYNIVPIYINKQGVWFSGPALTRIETYKQAIRVPENGRFEKVYLDISVHSRALLTMRPDPRGRLTETLVARLDCAVIVMHGVHGEDGSVQGLMELADVPYTSTGIVGSAVGMDKIIMKTLFRGAGIPVLSDVAVLRSRFRKEPETVLAEIEQALPYPLFVKPANLGSSIGVNRADDRPSLQTALEEACQYDRRILVEQGLDRPREVNCSVLGFDDEVRASVLEMPETDKQFLTFFEKYQRSGGAKGMASLGRRIPAPIPEELAVRVRSLSEKVFRLMDCKGVVRIDWMLDADDTLYITEINTIPGSLSFYLWNRSDPRLPYPELIDKLVEYAIRAHDEKSENNYAFYSDLFERMSLFGVKGSKGVKQ